MSKALVTGGGGVYWVEPGGGFAQGGSSGPGAR